LLTKNNDRISEEFYHIAFSISSSEGRKMQGLFDPNRVDMWIVVPFPYLKDSYIAEIQLTVGVLIPICKIIMM